MAVVSAAYGDASDGRAPTKSIYVRHVDSRNRVDPLTTTPSTYTYRVGTAPLQRVTTLQVGDAQLPADARHAVDYSRRHVGVSEPLRLADPTVLSVQETVTTYSRTTGAIVSGPTVFAAATVTLPPTLNDVGGVPGANTVTLSQTHGLAAMIAYWPSAAMPAYFVGGRMTAYTPAVSSTTLDAATPFPAVNQLQLDAVAGTADYVAHKTAAAGTLAGVLLGAISNATLYVQPLTIPEWAAVLSLALADLRAAGSLRQAYSVRLNDDTGAVELQCTGGDGVTQTTRAETTTTFTVTSGDAMWRLGFAAGSWVLPSYRSAAIDSSTGLRADSTPYVLSVPPRDVRVIQVPRGTYDASGLAAALTTASNGVFVPSTATLAQRTFHFTDVTGTRRAVVLPQGRYTPAQVAAFLTAQMNAIAAPAASNSFTVTQALAVNGTSVSGATVVYTFTNSLGTFALDFSDADAGLLAGVLGFETVRYSGEAEYTSPLAGTSATSTVTPSATDMRHVLTWTADTTRSRLRIAAASPVPSWEASRVDGAPAAANTWRIAATALDSAGVTAVAPHSDVGDVLTFYDGTNTLTALVVNAADGSADIKRLGVNFGAIDVLVDLAGMVLLTAPPPGAIATAEGRRIFVLHMARPPHAARAAAENVTGAALVNMTLERPLTAVGTGAALGPLAEVVGWPLTTTASTEVGVAVAPFAFALAPPPYVLLVLLAPRAASGRATFRAVGSDAELPVLAKFLVTSGFARITEESTHVSLTSAATVREVAVAWYHPDGTLVDWNGVNHSYSLLFRVWEGHAGGGGVD